ncbi:MAG: hypothetical protein FWD17_19345, partial [Polyangiaceae bacterium]|nr:hypothetical protein [Polyangiaceae bacterium]
LAEHFRGATPLGGVYSPQHLGLYTYVWNRPLTLVDPDGRQEGAGACVLGPGGCFAGAVYEAVKWTAIGIGTLVLVIWGADEINKHRPVVVPPANTATPVPPIVQNSNAAEEEGENENGNGERASDEENRADETPKAQDEAPKDPKSARPQKPNPIAGKTDEENRKGQKGSIKQAALEEGSPSWNDIQKETWESIEQKARADKPGYRTIRKLLTQKEYNKGAKR